MQQNNPFEFIKDPASFIAMHHGILDMADSCRKLMPYLHLMEHLQTLTTDPRFKSSMPPNMINIGKERLQVVIDFLKEIQRIDGKVISKEEQERIKQERLKELDKMFSQ